ncbi:MAG TPA: DUF692 family protein [Nitrospiraceae bacterium]|nr:DUF692 family protein [Nitrospiraceae bacterium]
MTDAHSEFVDRAGGIAVHGLGLSVDVYSPDLLVLEELLRRHRVPVQYYEIFQAALPALETVRERLHDRCLAYHGEGLWVSQPDFCPEAEQGSPLSEACKQLRALESRWLNIECATKQIAGRSFGTYLPPLYTVDGAVVAGENAGVLQQALDRGFSAAGECPPLLLLEMSPLTYFGCGSLPVPAFFTELVRYASCGLVLDIGHLWTVYRYTGAWRVQSVERFIAEFLDGFPLERVVEIHVAGLAEHPAEAGERGPDGGCGALPRWLDAHGAPIPELLFDMLDQVLSHPRLTALKGVALEVDTKEPSLIMSEFVRFHQRFSTLFARRSAEAQPLSRLSQTSRRAPAEHCSVSQTRRQTLVRDYEMYGRVATGQAESNRLPERVGTISDVEGLDRYRQVYLPHEILHWGGDLNDMFPRTCEMAKERAVALHDFVAFWFDRPRVALKTYDFFLLKIEYFLEFIAFVLPDALATAQREAEELRAGYEAANRRAGFQEITA